MQGFTLVELAMVLFIVTLLLGGMLVPLAAQLEGRQRRAAEEQLEQIREALIGYALINGYLPCPSTTSDPTSPQYGVEDSRTGGRCNFSEDMPGWTGDGILPWKTLGLNSGLDPWGVNRTKSTDPWVGYWRYRVQRAFTDDTNRFSLTTPAGDPGGVEPEVLCVVDANDNLLVAASETPIAIVYSTGPNREANRENRKYERTSPSSDCITSSDPGKPPIRYTGGPAFDEKNPNPDIAFDDLTIWLTRPMLFSRLVMAGVLP